MAKAGWLGLLIAACIAAPLLVFAAFFISDIQKAMGATGTNPTATPMPKTPILANATETAPTTIPAISIVPVREQADLPAPTTMPTPASTPTQQTAPKTHEVEIINATANEEHLILRALELSNRSVLQFLDRIVVVDAPTVPCKDEAFTPVDACAARVPGAIGCSDFPKREIRLVHSWHYISNSSAQIKSGAGGSGYTVCTVCATFANTLFHEIGHYDGVVTSQNSSEEYAGDYADRFAHHICSEDETGYSPITGKETQLCLAPLLRYVQYVRYNQIPFELWDPYILARENYEDCLTAG
jgi:hypothetical protein